MKLAYPGHGASRIPDSLAHREIDGLVDRADEQDRDLEPVEAVRDERTVGVGPELLQRQLAARSRVGERSGVIALAFEVVDLRLEVLALRIVDESAPGEADADEDAEHERDEDRGQRCHVVAEVEHASSLAETGLAAATPRSSSRGCP